MGQLDVDQVLAALPQRAWLDWYAYWELEPWGEERADVRSAIIAAQVFNAARGPRQAARPPADFLAHRPSRAENTPHHVAALKAALKARARPRHADPE